MSGWNDRKILGAALMVFIVLGLPFWHYRIDDTFIFLRFARNLSAGQGPAFNPGEPVYGFSSPSWVLILALAARLNVGTLAVAKLLALAAGCGAVWGFHAFARQRLAPQFAAAATLVWAANAWLIRWTASAMETALVLALVLWSLVLWEEERRDPGRRPWSAFLLGLLALTRPEGLLLLALALALTALRHWPRALVSACVAGAPLLPWLGYARATMGSWVPVTGAAKGTVGVALGLDPLRDVAQVAATTSGVEAVWVIVGLATAVVVRRSPPARDPGSPAMPGGGPHGALGAWRRGLAGGHALPLAWLVILPLFYAVTGFDVLSRYALPIVPVIVAYGFVALESAGTVSGWRLGLALTGAVTGAFLGFVFGLEPLPSVLASATAALVPAAVVASPTFRWRHALIALLVVGWNVVVLARIVYPHTRNFSRGVNECFQGLGEWFAAHTPADAQVAIADIGAFGYYSGRRVLDMAALISPELVPLVDRYSIQEIAAELKFAPIARPEYLVDRHTRPARLAGALGGAFELLPVPPCAIRGLGVRSPETIYYTAYRLDWDRYDAWAAAHGVEHE